ncbi:uncharacterized protein F4812DRAFT_410347 [Daldinia caldariorum]|uniref:uncharacterized protein n=1 Tax=Daldinia caldariorum TaxID=326644 RepID=UPI00200764D8|nr:uncharacterized protein F4812DRAFT_410347 [Daldinia caldariorum]KAI1472813.1 hypothetical protein F4812DRAFT_410347 [Daldinia caldariorum]
MGTQLTERVLDVSLDDNATNTDTLDSTRLYGVSCNSNHENGVPKDSTLKNRAPRKTIARKIIARKTKARNKLARNMRLREIRAQFRCRRALIDRCMPEAVVFRRTSSGNEAILEENPMADCPEDTVQDGGSVSGVMMVVATFEAPGVRRKVLKSTGVAINDYYIMTVAHAIWDSNFGLASSITVIRDIRADPSQENMRCVDAGAVHYQWARNPGDTSESTRKNDFAILHVSEPFHRGVQPMAYQEPPTHPTDVSIYGFPRGGPRLRYSTSHQVKYAPNVSGLLDHKGDTEYGSSGGPVVDISSGTAFGLHRGFAKKTQTTPLINKAVLLQVHGNDPHRFMQFIDDFTEENSTEDSSVIKGDEFCVGIWDAAFYR